MAILVADMGILKDIKGFLSPDAFDPQQRLVDETTKSILERPEEWRQEGRHTLDHTTGVELWVCNGRSSMAFYRPKEIKLTFRQRRKMWKAYKEHNKLIGEKQLRAVKQKEVQEMLDAIVFKDKVVQQRMTGNLTVSIMRYPSGGGGGGGMAGGSGASAPSLNPPPLNQ